MCLLGAALSAQEEKSAPLPRTLESGGRERVYHLYVPASLNREKAAPLLFCFHGAGGNGLGEMRPFRDLADQHGFLLVGPDGINKRWNAGCEDEIKATNGADDVGFVRDMVNNLCSEFTIDSGRIYAYGFSNGAALQHRLAAEIPGTFAAMSAAGAAMAVNTAERMKPGPPVSIQIMVGGEDSMFGHHGNLRGGTFHTATETAVIWSEHNECKVPIQNEKPVPFTRWPASTGVGEVELWIVEGAGHTPKMSEAFDTVSEAWQFLSRQRRESRSL